MAEPTAISVILEPIGLIVGGLASIHWSWYVSQLGRLLALPWKLALIPIAFIVRIVLIVLSPFLYVVGYMLSWIRAISSLIASLEFGTAAILGVTAGLILAVSTTLIHSYLGLHEATQDSLQVSKGRSRRVSSEDTESSSNETDWQWLDTTTSTSPTRRRPVSGLLSQTIHEEDDSSEGPL